MFKADAADHFNICLQLHIKKTNFGGGQRIKEARSFFQAMLFGNFNLVWEGTRTLTLF